MRPLQTALAALQPLLAEPKLAEAVNINLGKIKAKGGVMFENIVSDIGSIRIETGDIESEGTVSFSGIGGPPDKKIAGGGAAATNITTGNITAGQVTLASTKAWRQRGTAKDGGEGGEHREVMDAIAREKGIPVANLARLFEAVGKELPERDFEAAVRTAVETLLPGPSTLCRCSMILSRFRPPLKQRGAN